ncbi:MAG TPA: ester cyclase [Dehalococcoidia bacterium]|nr:ester cyclase [Dehalococcoidia bacterium]
MSIEEDNKARHYQLIEEVFNKKNLDLVPESFAPGFIDHMPVDELYGEKGTNFTAMLFNAFPDLHWKVEDMIAESDKLATRITMEGTFKGEYLGNAPTGNKVTLSMIIITKWQDGKEVEEWAVYDQLVLYRQLGITPLTP